MTVPATTTLDALVRAVRDVPDSTLRFDDGGHYRVEIPSVEGPAAFDAVVDEAARLDVPLHRVSQGSGIMLLRDADITAMAATGAAHGIEVCLFVGPRAPWQAVAAPLTPDGKLFGWRHMSVAALGHAYDDVVRACELGIRSVLVADEGLITLLADGRATGTLPNDLVIKASAVLGIANPLGAAMIHHAGADTINVSSDIPLGELAAFRTALPAPIDLYIESPDNLGGFMRYHELPELVRVAAPIHLKYGLRNAPNIYPSGAHLEAAAIATGRERVRRAAIGMEVLSRHSPSAGWNASPTGRARRGTPSPASTVGADPGPAT
ncbi:MAG TPA: hypothetical protein VFR11_05705 [Micromonosporaceae bacterium]|jgi:hypothetical protein|nr:hypothetical protein [Micromonosporaceae bacterium]